MVWLIFGYSFIRPIVENNIAMIYGKEYSLCVKQVPDVLPSVRTLNTWGWENIAVIVFFILVMV